ncbi:MAG: hypothetical protein JRH20_13535 [Deltaproteobacteria bacterium]|nr:hypothetical protein [Deltaproteobacteria bacterium]
MAVSVGADIESLCGKCGDVWHVVVAMVADRIAKVECKQCGRQHRHRPPNGAKPVAKAASPRRSSTKKATTRKTTAGAQSTSNMPLIEIDPKKPLRPYAITEEFATGDRVAHKRFGEGVVEMVLGPDKVQVFFADGGRRVMAQGR